MAGDGRSVGRCIGVCSSSRSSSSKQEKLGGKKFFVEFCTQRASSSSSSSSARSTEGREDNIEEENYTRFALFFLLAESQLLIACSRSKDSVYLHFK